MVSLVNCYLILLRSSSQQCSWVNRVTPTIVVRPGIHVSSLQINFDGNTRRISAFLFRFSLQFVANLFTAVMLQFRHETSS